MRRVLHRIAYWSAVVLAVGAVLISLAWLVRGDTVTSVAETPVGGDPGTATPEAIVRPFPLAAVPLTAAAVLLGGILGRRPRLALAAWAALSAFSALFLFSGGAALLPLAGGLLLTGALWRALRPP